MLLVQIRRAGGSVLIEARANSNTCHILLFSLYIHCYNNPNPITPILTYVINCSINSNKFAKVFRVAKVIPIYEQEDKHNTHFYRPISMKINMAHTTIGQSQ